MSDLPAILKFTDDPNCWPEDYAQENGQYLNRCFKCDSEFLGSKHRTSCKSCYVTRLLAVEVAAKIMAGPSNVRYSPESQDMAAYQCLTCHSSWDKKSDPVHASSCPVLVINPIGDQHE